SPEPLAGSAGRGELAVCLAASAAAALQALSSERTLSFETLAQGAWALVLSRRTGREDVLFGITAPARPAALPGVEAMVGRFANTLPLRVTVAPRSPLLPWLRALEVRRSALRPYEHVPLSRIEEWSGLPGGTPLLYSRLVVESFPVSIGGGIQWIEASSEPLAVFVRPGAEVALKMVYARARFEEAEILALLEELRSVLESFAADPRKRLSEIAAGPGELPAGETDLHRLDKIVQRVYRREIETLGGKALPAGRKAPGKHDIVPVPRDQPLPATFYQEWALQLDRAEKNSIPRALRGTGRLDLIALRRSLAELVRRHESLRTSFRWEGGEAYLVIAPPGEVPLPVVDLAALPAARRTEILDRLVAEHADHEFDMARGPLFIAQLVRVGERDHALLLNTHHIISDGWSLQVLQRELITLYTAFVEGRPSPLPPLPIQLADFAHWQRRVFAGEALEAQIAWWRKTLANLPPPPALPIDRPRPEVLGLRAIELTGGIAPGPTRTLRTLVQTTRSSLPMVLLAAIDALLHAYSGEEDLILSLIFAARNRLELSGQIGLYMNTVPLRVDLSGNPSFRQLVERVRDATVEAYSHQDIPFPRLLTELFPGRKLTRTMLSGVCFNMLSFAGAGEAPAAGAALPGDLTLQPIVADVGGAKHDLVVACSETRDSINFELAAAADLFTPERVRRIASDFKALLAQVTADPDIPLDRLRKLLTPA
ncbi:MAG TPA: condensation domain-containing protein, partial [Thermoanaerobaculia bacterium]|nr:condensation domain-containing protein [Thermoanaerobaculia bacterium]